MKIKRYMAFKKNIFYYMEFPKSFDVNIYKNCNNDLSNMTDTQAISHYSIFGKNEGRICSIIKNRIDIKNIIESTEYKCLEIGPFDCPVLTGNNIEYFDVLNREDLIKRAHKINRINNINNIPFINYVDVYGNLDIIDKKFDIVLSAHSIEHQVNFIKHLKSISCLLKNNGVYVILLPDKRYCFDHFIKESTIADIFEQYVNNRNNHTIKSIIEHRVLTCHNNSHKHWNNEHGTNNFNEHNIINAIKEYNDSVTNNTYIDVHSLQFTPDSFENIINTLYNLKYIDFVVDKVYPTIKYSNEFIVILRKKL